MKAVASAAAAALLVSRVAGADVADAEVSAVEPRTEVEIDTIGPACAVDADGLLLQDCCMALTTDDVDCGAGYVRIVAYGEAGCQSDRLFTVCARLGLEDPKCGDMADFTEAIPETCAQFSQLVGDVEGKCFSDDENIFGMQYSCKEATSSNSGEGDGEVAGEGDAEEVTGEDDSEVAVPPTPSPFFVDTWAPTWTPNKEIGGSGAGPTPSPFFVDTWAPTRFPTIEEGGSGVGPTMAVSSPPTTVPSYLPTPSPKIVTNVPTVSPTIDDSEEDKEGESDDVSGSRMLAASLKITAAFLAIIIAMQ